jgi:hypothetical protein
MHIESVENKDNAKVSPPPTPPPLHFHWYFTHIFSTHPQWCEIARSTVPHIKPVLPCMFLDSLRTPCLLQTTHGFVRIAFLAVAGIKSQKCCPLRRDMSDVLLPTN